MVPVAVRSAPPPGIPNFGSTFDDAENCPAGTSIVALNSGVCLSESLCLARSASEFTESLT
jgi:hypothetical protein